jgi:hypothetical protein
MKRSLIYEISSLSICPPLIAFELTNFHKLRQGDHATEDDIDTITVNPIASTILKWQLFKLLRWMQTAHHQSAMVYEGLNLVTMVINYCFLQL